MPATSRRCSPRRAAELTLSVSLGRLVDGKYRPMSDTALVTFEAPDDLRALDQTYNEYREVIGDLVTGYDDLERWLGRAGTGSGRSLWNRDPAQSFAAAFFGADGACNSDLVDVGLPLGLDILDTDDNHKGILVAHFNNQLP